MSDPANPKARPPASDPAAFAAFLDEKRSALLAYVVKRLGPTLKGKIEPQDIAQEAAIKALKELPTTDLGNRDPFGWLCHLADQCVVDAHRRFSASKRAAGREQAANVIAADGSQDFIALLTASMTTPSQAAVRNERETNLRAAIATLPVDQREVLRLRYVEGMPTKEIASLLKKTDVAVRVMLARLIKRLQEILGPGEGSP